MNFFGLARRSVFRKPVKSILLLLIVFAISTLLLAGVASKNASVQAYDSSALPFSGMLSFLFLMFS